MTPTFVGLSQGSIPAGVLAGDTLIMDVSCIYVPTAISAGSIPWPQVVGHGQDGQLPAIPNGSGGWSAAYGWARYSRLAVAGDAGAAVNNTAHAGYESIDKAWVTAYRGAGLQNVFAATSTVAQQYNSGYVTAPSIPATVGQLLVVSFSFGLGQGSFAPDLTTSGFSYRGTVVNSAYGIFIFYDKVLTAGDLTAGKTQPYDQAAYSGYGPNAFYPTGVEASFAPSGSGPAAGAPRWMG